MPPSENIKVVGRVRPPRQDKRTTIACNMDGKTVEIKSEYGERYAFGMDRAFSQYSGQEDVFSETAEPLLSSMLQGINTAVIAYGQTGSGKTHTMMGGSEPGEEGIVPRMIRSLFSHIQDMPVDEQVAVSMSVVQVYKERVLDLLDPGLRQCEIIEDRSRGIWVTNASDEPINSWDESRKLFADAESRRAVRCTNMNDVSSRSHMVFIVTMSRRRLADHTEKSSQLYLCDLAGSECIAKSGDGSLQETKTINTGLLALRRCIDAIVFKADHVPFRDSKLTRLLQNSFGGSARTVLLVCLSPEESDERESVASLRFGVSTQKITNSPTENVHRSAEELERLIRETRDEVQKVQAAVRQLQRQVEADFFAPPTARYCDAASPSPPSSEDSGDLPQQSSYELVSAEQPDPDVPEEFICPLSGRLMVTPVVASDGITYEKEVISKHVDVQGGPPGCDRFLDSFGCDLLLIPNHNLANQIAEFNARRSALAA
eukprot:Hpha_TRINITY_DN10073_c0_g1::TRINITY_DN10073_c0_g1_i1::g.84160::m.84160/K10396/KIF5; kinesin family member 5